MAAIEVMRRLSTAGYVFAADNAITSRGFLDETLQRLAAELRVKPEASTMESDGGVWLLRRGSLVLGGRKLALHSVAGADQELTCVVDGDTQDALDVLKDVWGRLQESGTTAAPDIDGFEGGFLYGTTAVFRSPIGAHALLPPLAVFESAANEHFGDRQIKTPGAVFRLEYPVVVSYRGATVEKKFTIEPRANSVLGDRLFFTTSPLPWPEHLAMFEKLVAMLSPGASPLASRARPELFGRPEPRPASRGASGEPNTSQSSSTSIGRRRTTDPAQEQTVALSRGVDIDVLLEERRSLLPRRSPRRSLPPARRHGQSPADEATPRRDRSRGRLASRRTARATSPATPGGSLSSADERWAVKS